MSSINLLPKSFDLNDKKKRKSGSGFAILVSFMVILVPIALYAVLHFKNIDFSEEIDNLNSEVEIIDGEIREKIKNNKLLMVENKATDANNLLAQHPYFTKIINLINESLVTDIYLTSLIIDFDKQEFITVDLEAVAKNSSTIASQILIFKNMPYINNVNIREINPTKEGYTDFGVELEIKKQTIFYKEFSINKKINENYGN